MLKKSPREICRIRIRNNRIVGANFLNRSCAFDARLESMLLEDPPQNPFSTVSPSRPGEFHPEPLTDPDLTLSRHPARATARRLPPSVETWSSSCCQLARSQRR